MKKTLVFAFVAAMMALPETAQAKVDVMAVYYPHWHRYPKGDEWFGADNWKEGEWCFVKSAKPFFPGHCQPMVPYGGYRDESNPDEMSVEIALAANAGIDVFLYDYYYYNGEVTQEEALEKGFLGAPNRDRMKFAIMWCFHERNDQFRPEYGKPRLPLMKLARTPEEFLGLIDLCCERYFPCPEYYCKEGKLFFSVYNAPDFVESLGRDVAAKAIREARERVRAKGLGELHLNGMNVEPRHKELVSGIGFDSFTHYGGMPWNSARFREGQKRGDCLFDYSVIGEGTRKHWSKMRESGLPFFPLVASGWDCTPRCRRDVPFPWPKMEYPYCHVVTNNTPNAFEAELRAAKAFAEKNAPDTQIVYINGWNEYTEGMYLIPNNFTADGMLRSVAAVFGRKPSDEYTYINPSTKQLFTVPAATHENVAYGPHSKQKVDVWLPKGAKGKTPLIVYIHGGGWDAGTMEDDILAASIRMMLDRGVAVVAVGYRYLRDTELDGVNPPVAGCMEDCERALGFVRSRAGEWKLDLSRLALAGADTGALEALRLGSKAGGPKVCAVAMIAPGADAPRNSPNVVVQESADPGDGTAFRRVAEILSR